MASVIPYKWLQIVDPVTQLGGQTLNTDFQAIADNTGPATIASRDPAPTDDINAGYYPWSKWYNDLTEDFFRCIDNAVGAADWIRVTAIPGGSDKEVQYNNAGKLEGFGSYDSGSNKFSVLGGTVSSDIAEFNTAAIGTAGTMSDVPYSTAAEMIYFQPVNPAKDFYLGLQQPADQKRAYFYWAPYDDPQNREFIFGYNSGGSINLWNGVQGNHPLTVQRDGRTLFQSAGNQAILVNATVGDNAGTGGMLWYAGGASPLLMARLDPNNDDVRWQLYTKGVGGSIFHYYYEAGTLNYYERIRPASWDFYDQQRGYFIWRILDGQIQIPTVDLNVNAGTVTAVQLDAARTAANQGDFIHAYEDGTTKFLVDRNGIAYANGFENLGATFTTITLRPADTTDINDTAKNVQLQDGVIGYEHPTNKDGTRWFVGFMDTGPVDLPYGLRITIVWVYQLTATGQTIEWSVEGSKIQTGATIPVSQSYFSGPVTVTGGGVVQETEINVDLTDLPADARVQFNMKVTRERSGPNDNLNGTIYALTYRAEARDRPSVPPA